MRRLFPFLDRTGRRGGPPRAPDGVAAWAIGDVHGRLDLLAPLLDAVLADLAASGAERRVLVLLGDYVDRGPESRGVLARVAALVDAAEVEVHALRGNHEQQMSRFLAEPQLGPAWGEFGGLETLASYGVAPPAGRSPEAWAEASAALDRALPERHRRLLGELETAFELGDWLFVHAGVRPGVPLARQSEDDMLWIRDAFLDDPAPFERMVVHGHTPGPLHLDHRRIGIDTGAYATGRLTALRLEGERREVIQTAAAGRLVRLERRPL